MKATFNISENRLLIKAIDEFYNIYSQVVTKTDPFVVNFCNKDLNVLVDLFKNYEIEENDGFVVVKIIKPIYLSYKLEKQEAATADISNMIMGKLQEMQLQINSQNTRIQGLEEQLEHGVILPGGGVIDKNEKQLYLCVGNKQNNQISMDNFYFSFGIFNKTHARSFTGTNIKSVKFLRNLDKFVYCDLHIDFTRNPYTRSGSCHYKAITDFSTLKYCKELTGIYFRYSLIVDISFMEELKELEEVYFVGCPELQTINVLAKLPNLKKFGYQNCPKIGSLPDFNSKVVVEKK